MTQDHESSSIRIAPPPWARCLSRTLVRTVTNCFGYKFALCAHLRRSASRNSAKSIARYLRLKLTIVPWSRAGVSCSGVRRKKTTSHAVQNWEHFVDTKDIRQKQPCTVSVLLYWSIPLVQPETHFFMSIHALSWSLYWCLYSGNGSKTEWVLGFTGEEERKIVSAMTIRTDRLYPTFIENQSCPVHTCSSLRS